MTPLTNLEYDVIHATSCDDSYPAQQLLPKDKSGGNDGGIKHGKGWQSRKHCRYPQEIILQVKCGTARVRKMQILSHHYKIASKVEIYVGSIQRRKEIAGITTDIGRHDEKRTLLWDRLPKIIDNDGISSDEDETPDVDDDEEDYVKDDYDLIKTNGEPYIHFRRLGYCSLDSNERAKYKARELKSVRLDTEGEYIRLVARRCHSNQLNQFNQVGIIGISIMGEPVNYLLAGESRTIPLEYADEGLSRVASPETCIIPFAQDNNHLMINNNPNDQRNFASLYSILPNPLVNSSSSSLPTQVNKITNPIKSNDFLLNIDETAQLISAFGRAKKAAVKVEDFQSAKILKYAIDLVKQISEKVLELDALKKQAVEEEDFDNADMYKRDIEALRTEVAAVLTDEGIDVDESGEIVFDSQLGDIVGLADDINEVPYESPDVLSGREHQLQHHDQYQYQVPAECVFGAPNPPKSRTSSDSSLTLVSSPAALPRLQTQHLKSRTNSDAAPPVRPTNPEPVTPTTPKFGPLPWEDDDRPLPTLVNSNVCHMPPPLSSSSLINDTYDDSPEGLSELARSAFGLSISHFGDYVIACLLSKKFPLRESALEVVTKKLDVDYGDGKEISGNDKVALVKATFQVIQEALNDNPERLTLQALGLWDILTSFCEYHQIPLSSTWKFVDSAYQMLFGKISDTNPRIKQSATDLLVHLARTYRSSNQSMLSLVLKPAKTSSQAPKQAKAKVELVTRLVEVFGIALNPPKDRMDKDLGLSLEAVLQVSVSYLNNNNGEVRDLAVKLVFEVVKRVGREKVEGFIADIKPILLENIWNLVTEYEETTGKICGHVPSPPPSPKTYPKNLIEEEKQPIEDFDVDETLLKMPLAQRGTVTRLEQQLMELRSLMNNTNSIIKEDYDTYIANSTKVSHQQPEEIKEIESKKSVKQLQNDASTNPSRCETPSVPSKSEKASVPPKKVITKPTSKSHPKRPNDAAKKPSKTAPTTKQPIKDTTAHRRGSTDEIKKDIKKQPVTSRTDTYESEDYVHIDESKSERCCIFCDEQNDKFTEENLVTHYWNECPVLTKCRLCSIILEISTLDDHMLTDCDKSKFVKQCPRCREVIEADDYLEHIAKQTCLVIRDDIVRCPLCKTVVKPATEAGWKAHLLETNGCPKNRRKSNNSKPRAPSMVKEMENATAANGGKKRPTEKTGVTKPSSTVSKTPSKIKPVASSNKDKVKKPVAKVSKPKK